MIALSADQVAALVETLQTVNRNILDEANKIGEGYDSYVSLLGEAAGVRMAIGFIQQAADVRVAQQFQATGEKR